MHVCLVSLSFYGVSTLVGYFMPNYLFIYILNIYDLVWFGLVWFDDISTIAGYLVPNPFYTFILNMIGFGLVF